MEPSLFFISILLGQLKVITLVFFGFAIRPIAAAAGSTQSSNVCVCLTCSLINAISSAKSRSYIHTGIIFRLCRRRIWNPKSSSFTFIDFLAHSLML